MHADSVAHAPFRPRLDAMAASMAVGLWVAVVASGGHP